MKPWRNVQGTSPDAFVKEDTLQRGVAEEPAGTAAVKLWTPRSLLQGKGEELTELLIGFSRSPG